MDIGRPLISQFTRTSTDNKKASGARNVKTTWQSISTTEFRSTSSNVDRGENTKDKLTKELREVQHDDPGISYPHLLRDIQLHFYADKSFFQTMSFDVDTQVSLLATIKALLTPWNPTATTNIHR